MNFPANLKYTKSHEWVEFIDDTTARVGLTDFAQHSLGEIVFVNLPEPGDAVSMGAGFAEVESVKAVSDVFCPFTGSISQINEDVPDAPEKINADPYGTWLAEISDITEAKEFLDADAYEKLCAEEA